MSWYRTSINSEVCHGDLDQLSEVSAEVEQRRRSGAAHLREFIEVSAVADTR